jgi:LacI family transcriptional regulator
MGYTSVMTISEIAKLANVSIGTVDRVLHKRGRVAPETIEKVLSIIEEFGYQPNTYARNLKLSKTFSIGILLPSLHSDYGYWNLVYEGVLKAAKELVALSVSIDLIQFDRENPETFLEAGEKLFLKHPDAILFPPVLPAVSRIFLKAHPDIEYAFIDSPLPDTNPVVTVVQNPFKGGYLAGRMMHLLSPGKGTYLTIQTYADAYNSSERSRGFCSFFQEKEGYSVVELNMNLAQEGKKALEQAFGDYPDSKGIFVVNDAVHQVATIVSLLGRKKETTLIGYDLIEQNRKAMIAGNVDCLLSQRPDFQGYTAIYQLYRKNMLGQLGEGSIDIPIDIILLENLQEEQSVFNYSRPT